MFRRRMVVLGLGASMVIAAGLTAGAGPDAINRDPVSALDQGSNTGPQGRTFFSGGILSQLSGKGLDVKDRSTEDDAPVQLWDYVGGPNQAWNIIDLGRNEYAIMNIRSSKALDISGASRQNGATLVQSRWRSTDSQRWRLERRNQQGLVQVVNVQSGKCLDVKDNSRQNGATIQQWECNAGAANQTWRLSK